jgi:leucyl-tRNA synthetase
MADIYDHKQIESKWQEKWAKDRIYEAKNPPNSKPKKYVLDMYPYPSGEGLHVGHPKGYIATDVYSRFSRMKGFNVLHPMGWDAFGLPAEQYAIKNKVHPKISVAKNIARYKEQLEMIGLDYDWSREINTTDPTYYKWTQWCFVKMFEKGLVYQSNEPINWCPSCKTGLANEDLEDGKCERCGSEIEQKKLPQWVIKITDYADRLLEDLGTLTKWPEYVKTSQRNWIGREEHDGKVTYNLRDWVFARQRYWGEPIPIIHCGECGPVTVPEKDLPVMLPEVESYEPTDNGESPLAGITDWVNTTCPKCGGEAKRETNTMPQWAGSSWYYLRYMDPQNDQALVGVEKEKYWKNVDVYVGGMEHATRHLIYARFWHKFLYDIGTVSTKEPFEELHTVGLIQADDGRKMSKRWGNVVNPDEMVGRFGADAFRLYEMFMGPFEQAVAWNTDGVVGTRRFLERVWDIKDKVSKTATTNLETSILLNKTIKKITQDIKDFKFNTCVSSMMILINQFLKDSDISEDDYKKFLQLLAPFAPHMTEELWYEIGETESIHISCWPAYDEEKIKDDKIHIVVQINGKLRDEVDVDTDTDEETIKKLVLSREKVVEKIAGAEIKKVIYIKDKLVNIVI